MNNFVINLIDVRHMCTRNVLDIFRRNTIHGNTNNMIIIYYCRTRTHYDNSLLRGIMPHWRRCVTGVANFNLNSTSIAISLLLEYTMHKETNFCLWSFFLLCNVKF